MSDTYRALVRWVMVDGYRVSGPAAEVRLIGPADGREPGTYLTQVLLPIDT